MSTNPNRVEPEGDLADCFPFASFCTKFSFMTDLTNPRVIKLKGLMFLVIGLLSSALLILEVPTLRVAALLCISVWCFCRFYYFAFYVIEHYVDPTFRFSGLIAFTRYLLTRPK
jgi:hypothetical protein